MPYANEGAHGREAPRPLLRAGHEQRQIPPCDAAIGDEVSEIFVSYTHE
jgi:hypothetical protein